MADVLDDITVTITADTRGFVAAGRRAARAMDRFGTALRLIPPTGRRRHGLVKHLRDLKRAEAKRVARLIKAGHRRLPDGSCPVCPSQPNAEHVAD